MVLYRGPFSQPFKLVVSIKMNRQTNGHKKSFRSTTKSLVFKGRFKNQQCECRSCPVHVPQVRSETSSFWHEMNFCLRQQLKKLLNDFSKKTSLLLLLCSFQPTFSCWWAVTLSENRQSQQWKLHQREPTLISYYLVATIYFFLIQFVSGTTKEFLQNEDPSFI